MVGVLVSHELFVLGLIAGSIEDAAGPTMVSIKDVAGSTADSIEGAARSMADSIEATS